GRHVHALAAVPGPQLEPPAGGHQLELLDRARAAGVLDELGAVVRRGAHHVEALAAVAAEDGPVAAARVLEAPVLPVVAVVGVLADAGAVVGVGLLHVHGLAAVAGVDAVVRGRGGAHVVAPGVPDPLGPGWVADGQVQVGAAAAQRVHRVVVVAGA